jgi:signal recognition particle GTPase
VKLIDKAMGVQTQMTQNEIVGEVLQHHIMAESRCEIFRGRQEMLDAIQETLSRDDRGLLVIHGVSGCGKTSIMAKSAQMVRKCILVNNLFHCHGLDVLVGDNICFRYVIAGLIFTGIA